LYCKKCGKEIEDEAFVCVYCGVLVNEQIKKTKFYTAGFVLGILSVCLPGNGFVLGVIGLCLSCISKRKSAIILNIIGIIISVGIIILVIIGSLNNSYFYENQNTVQMNSDLYKSYLSYLL